MPQGKNSVRDETRGQDLLERSLQGSVADDTGPGIVVGDLLFDSLPPNKSDLSIALDVSCRAMGELLRGAKAKVPSVQKLPQKKEPVAFYD